MTAGAGSCHLAALSSINWSKVFLIFGAVWAVRKASRTLLKTISNCFGSSCSKSFPIAVKTKNKLSIWKVRSNTSTFLTVCLFIYKTRIQKPIHQPRLMMKRMETQHNLDSICRGEWEVQVWEERLPDGFSTAVAFVSTEIKKYF